ncbi:MAG TPA: thioesterase domain-containing protein, partial [Thermoanaerobaculia bacterium]|nr:thioesterase domain-containing protein [Thermoanaerobaculia bacterium]
PADEALRAALRRTLPEHMVPSRFVLLDALPRTPNGKIDRRRLPEPDAAAPRSTGSERRAPRDAVELELVRIWEEVLGEPAGVADDFFALGGHSLLAVRLVSRIQQRFGRDLPLSIVFQRSTVETMAEMLRQEEVVTEPPILVPLQTGGAGRPLFCVHPIGGNVFCYVELARNLGPEEPFYGLQASLPGAAEEAGGAAPTVETMAERYLDAVREVQPDGPYRLAGWSFGGVVAYEMARQLRAAGEDVELLAVIDGELPEPPAATAGPGGPEPAAPGAAPLELDPLERLTLLVRDLEGLGGVPLRLDTDALRRLAPERRLAAVLEHAQAAGALPAGAAPEQLLRLGRIYDANLHALLRYRPEPYPGRLTFVRPAGRPAAELAAARWAGLAAGVDIVAVPGNHYTILREPQVGDLARRLAACLADGRHPGGSS